jgi:hypothetical protein
VLTVGVAWFADRFRSDPLQPFGVIGILGLAVLVLAALTPGWRAFSMPLLGGTMFDGVRFYGLPNSFFFLLLGSSLFVASRLGAWPGFAVLGAAGLFAGLPWLGADLGGAVSMFVAAGLWWALASRRRFDLRALVQVAGTVLAGTVVVLLVNRYAPGTPTHVTRFVEHSGTSVGGAVGRLGDRLGVGWRQLNDVPAAALPLIGLVALLVLAIRRVGPVDRGLRFVDRTWREVLIVLTVGGLVSFVVNDTGVATAAPVFLSSMAATTYAVMLAVRAGAGAPTPAGAGVPP